MEQFTLSTQLIKQTTTFLQRKAIYNKILKEREPTRHFFTLRSKFNLSTLPIQTQSYRKLNQIFPRHHRCFAYVCHKLKLADFTHTIFTLSLRWQGEPLNRLTPGGRYKTEIVNAEEKKLVNCATVYRFCQIITRGTERKKKQKTKGNKNKHTGSSFEQADL